MSSGYWFRSLIKYQVGYIAGNPSILMSIAFNFSFENRFNAKEDSTFPVGDA
jgi:hypothetical protein